MRTFFSFAFFILFASAAFSQHDEHTSAEKDTNCLAYYCKKGRFYGHARSFLMATDNAGRLPDYYALAGGAGIGYESASIRGFQFGVSGFFIYNMLSSNLGFTDSITRTTDRYEISLFDIEDPSNKSDLDRLEELYLKYSVGKNFVQVGKIILNTPFLNKQDGRMRPTVVEGAWMEVRTVDHLKLEGGWIWDISPRGTVRWYSVAESIGIYPVGVDENGARSNYSKNLESLGLGIAGITWAKSGYKLQAWNYHTQNIFNLAFFQADKEFKANDNRTFYTGVQYTREDAVKQGGSEDPSARYFKQGSFSNIIGARAGYRFGHRDVSINYTHVTGDGKFLFPREWGREGFYTFMPRERAEGLGNLHAVVLRAEQSLLKDHFKLGVAYGYFHAPDVKNYRLNKYGMPAFDQLNIDLRYAFQKFLKGGGVQLLIVYKGQKGDTYGNYRFVANKVNMTNYNLVLDYTF